MTLIFRTINTLRKGQVLHKHTLYKPACDANAHLTASVRERMVVPGTQTIVEVAMLAQHIAEYVDFCLGIEEKYANIKNPLGKKRLLIGARLRYARVNYHKHRGTKGVLSQEELAKSCEISQGAIQKSENARAIPRKTSEIAAVLGVPEWWLTLGAIVHDRALLLIIFQTSLKELENKDVV